MWRLLVAVLAVTTSVSCIPVEPVTESLVLTTTDIQPTTVKQATEVL